MAFHGQCREGREKVNLQGLVLLADSTSSSRCSPVTLGRLWVKSNQTGVKDE